LFLTNIHYQGGVKVVVVLVVLVVLLVVVVVVVQSVQAAVPCNIQGESVTTAVPDKLQ
jgi:hypothetical protein